MMEAVTFAPFDAADALAIAVQPSQWIEAGLDMRDITAEGAADLAASGAAWTARAADPGSGPGQVGRILCCAGLREVFAGRQAVAWAMLATDLGVRQHLAITRFARARIAESPLARIESLIADDTRCRKWAEAVGLHLRAVLPCWGAASETIFLYDRVLRCRR